MTIEQGLQAISSVGFPIVVALFALFRLEKTIKENTRVLTVIATKIGLDATKEENN